MRVYEFRQGAILFLQLTTQLSIVRVRQADDRHEVGAKGKGDRGGRGGSSTGTQISLNHWLRLGLRISGRQKARAGQRASMVIVQNGLELDRRPVTVCLKDLA